MAHKYRKKWLKFALIPVILLTASRADFTTECQRPCDCRWQSGNKAAICSNSSLRTIPANLSSDIQILDASNNAIRQLHAEAFKKVGLSNLKKLFLKDCYIESIHKSAFVTLAIMIELDLSKNRIQSLHPDTFRGTEKLRLINLSNNFIDMLEDGLFRNLKYLQKVEMSNNRIVRIATKTFVNLPQLKILRFDGNNLSHMKPETLMALSNLSGLDLHNNPWRCDCNLQMFRNWVISHNLYTAPTSCMEPPPLRDKLWNELDSSNFACRPTILEPTPDATVKSYDENVTLTCKVVGNPTPEVTWRYNGKTIDTRPFGEVRYVVSDNTVDLIRWVNLSILNARYSDRGNYTCVAENPGGRDEKTLTLILSKFGTMGRIAGMDADTFAILVGCLTTVLVIFGAVAAVWYLTSHKNDAKKLIKPESHNTNGEALIESSIGSEIEKGFVCEVNPLTKPPRKHETAPSLTSNATEMSELNRTLLDNDSTSGANDDNIRHQESELLPKISQETLLLDRISQDSTYPPDLLSFPLRGGPANVQDPTTSHNSGSPLKSPAYGVALNTGIYNRLHLPSTSQGTVPVTSSKGAYITLPRRPRANNWLPESNINQQMFTHLNGVAPNYDNFGMKIFGTGSNYCSLNKSEIDIGAVDSRLVNTRKKYNVKHSVDEPDDVDPAPSPAPGTPHATLLRNSISSPNIHNQLIALQAMSLSQQRPLKFPIAEPRPLTILSSLPQYENMLRNSTVKYSNSHIASSIGHSRNPPRPLPKPRNKPIDMREPFLNNSGETATQV